MVNYHFHDERLVHNHTVALRDDIIPGIVYGFENQASTTLVEVPNMEEQATGWLSSGIGMFLAACIIAGILYALF